MIPPKPVRRLVLGPAVPLLTLLFLVSVPLWIIPVAFLGTVVPGRWRGLRVLWFTMVFLVVESLMVLWLFVLWVGSGFGYKLQDERWQARHYRAMRWYLDLIVGAGRHTFHAGIDIDLAHADLDATEGTPILVFSRHAGPGDSFLLVHGLLRAGYRPRIVLKETMQWAPAADIGLNRLPAYFVKRGAPRGTGTRAVRTLAAGLGGGDALVLFPEGRNFTPQRRLHSISRLEELGRHDEAEEAREMRYVLTPRAGGALAALEGAPDADVVFVAHSGLEDLSSVVDIWHGIPIDADVHALAWRVPREDIPRVREAQDAWLQWWWRRLDAWLVETGGEEAVPDAVVEAVAASDVEPPPV